MVLVRLLYGTYQGGQTGGNPRQFVNRLPCVRLFKEDFAFVFGVHAINKEINAAIVEDDFSTKDSRRENSFMYSSSRLSFICKVWNRRIRK